MAALHRLEPDGVLTVERSTPVLAAIDRQTLKDDERRPFVMIPRPGIARASRHRPRRRSFAWSDC